MAINKRTAPTAQFAAAGLVDNYGRLTEKIAELEAEKATYADALREALSKLVTAKVRPTAEGGEWIAFLIPTTVTVVNVQRFKAACPTRHFLACVGVNIGRAQQLVGDAVLAKASVTTPGSPRLLVELKGVKRNGG